MSKHSIQKAAPFDPVSAPDFLPQGQLRELQLHACKTWSRKPSTTSPSSAAA